MMIAGIGPGVLQGNWRLIRRTLEMLDKVLDAGPRGTYFSLNGRTSPPDNENG